HTNHMRRRRARTPGAPGRLASAGTPASSGLSVRSVNRNPVDTVALAPNSNAVVRTTNTVASARRLSGTRIAAVRIHGARVMVVWRRIVFAVVWISAGV